MKFFVIFVYTLVKASADYLAPVYQGYLQVLLISKHGVPESLSEVQQARFPHIDQIAADKSYAYSYANLAHNVLQESKENFRYFDLKYVPVVNKFGVPGVNKEVKLAKQANLAQIATAKYYGYTFSNLGNYPQHAPVINKYGYPEDTGELKNARSLHLSAVVAANSHGNSYSIPHYHQANYVETYEGPQHCPAIGKNNVVDTIEVKKARAQYLSYITAPKSSDAQKYSKYQRTSYQIQHPQQAYQGPQHIPVINKLIVPENTEEFKTARYVNMTHLDAAKLIGYEIQNYQPKYTGQNYFTFIGQDGLPEEIIDVESAKAPHLTEAAAAKDHLNVVDKASVDTVEFQNAKVEHLAKVEVTKKYLSLVGSAVQITKPEQLVDVAAKQYLSFIDESGILEDTIDVQNAKPKHLGPAAKAKTNAYVPVVNHQGFSVDTDIHHAKAEPWLIYKTQAEARDKNLRRIQQNSQGKRQEYYDEPIAQEDASDDFYSVIKPTEYGNQEKAHKRSQAKFWKN